RLALGGDRGRRERLGREAESDEEVDVVARDQLLRESLGDLGRRAGGVAAQDLDLLAGDGIAMLLEPGLDAVLDLPTDVGERARERGDETELDGGAGGLGLTGGFVCGFVAGLVCRLVRGFVAA